MPNRKILICFISVIGLIALSSNAHIKNQNIGSFGKVQVEGGIITGMTNASGDIQIFKGIPFAAPPVGDLRWKAPQPVIHWTGEKKCIAFGASPMQNSPSPFGPWSEAWLIPKSPISEDCLYLNVWTAAKSAAERKPVIVWIYGGGFMSGGAACSSLRW